MIELNGKEWSKLTFEDIVELLKNDTDESFFLEYKCDQEDNTKFIKEVCAFANSFGGYIVLGVNDDKTISGCDEWDENRIHNVIRNCISPIPNFDVRTLNKDSQTIVVVRVEEGKLPPYITNNGKIYIRVSSSSNPIRNASELQILINKRKEQEDNVNRKIQLPQMEVAPPNYCGYIDLGFSVVADESFDFTQKFYGIDLSQVLELLNSDKNKYSISRLGNSLLITIGELKNPNNHEKPFLVPSGCVYMLEIFKDSSVRMRLPLIGTGSGNGEVDIMDSFYLCNLFRDVYASLVGKEFYKHFIMAQKYEEMRVLKQFYPIYDSKRFENQCFNIAYKKRSEDHELKYGKNTIPIGHRIPSSGYDVIDEHYFVKRDIEYTNTTLLDCLFYTSFGNLGYIDFVDLELIKNSKEIQNNQLDNSHNAPDCP